jgi:hypothetical protein
MTKVESFQSTTNHNSSFGRRFASPIHGGFPKAATASPYLMSGTGRYFNISSKLSLRSPSLLLSVSITCESLSVSVICSCSRALQTVFQLSNLLHGQRCCSLFHERTPDNQHGPPRSLKLLVQYMYLKMRCDHGIRIEIDKSEQEQGPCHFRRLVWRERCWKSSKLVNHPKDNLDIHYWKHRIRMVSHDGTAWLVLYSCLTS